MACCSHPRNEVFALQFAAELGGSDSTIIRRAGLFLRFLDDDPVRLRLTLGPARNHTTQAPTGPVTSGGPGMAQIHDDEEFDITVTAQDAKGFAAVDTFTAVSSDETVATLVSGAAGTWTVVAGSPGSAVVTVADEGGLSATLAVDVVPGNVALINISAGEPRPQTP